MVTRTWDGNEQALPGRGLIESLLDQAQPSRKLPLVLALVGAALTSPAMLIGKQLDDFFQEYFASGLPGADRLVPNYWSFFSIATGDPKANHALIEEGLAPYWMHERLLLNFFRPIAALTHRIDYALYPHSPWLMHLHSIAWYGVGIYAATLFFRSIAGMTRVAALASFLFAVDHTHGLPVGWISNRNALIAFAFGALALVHHDRGQRGNALSRWLGPVFLLAGFLGGEIALSAWGYLVAHAVFLDDAPVKKRIVGLLPYLAVTVAWRVAYSALGYGGFGSGMYVDPVHEPLDFAAHVLTRVPYLFLGLFAGPPAEAAYFFGPVGARIILYAGIVCILACLYTLKPLLETSRTTRYWVLGIALSLLPACTAFPHNRLLMFPSLGAMALLSKLVLESVTEAPWLPRLRAWQITARAFLFVTGSLHVFISPLLLPLAAVNVAVTNGITSHAVPSALGVVAKSGARDLVVVTAPDYYYTALIRVQQRLAGTPALDHLRLLSIGPVAMNITRLDAHRLRVDYQGGLLGSARTELYRAARFPMSAGTRITLEGMDIELTKVTSDGRPESVLFTLTEPIDSTRIAWVTWNGNEYVPFQPPKTDGEVIHVAPAPALFKMTS